MILLTAQAVPLDPKLQAIRDSFNQPGAWKEFTVILAVVIGAVLAVQVFMRVRRYFGRERHRPKALFLDLVRDLGFSAEERNLLRGLAAGMRLEHPAVLLLSPDVLNDQLQAWRETARPGPAISDDAVTALLGRVRA